MDDKSTPHSKRVSDPTIRRLSIYYKTLDILEENGTIVVSSDELAAFQGIASAQVRKDLSLFGSFGYRGMGYFVSSLKQQIAKILGLNRTWNIVLIGAGQFSTVLMNSEIFLKKNLRITKIFDKTPELIGTEINGVIISDIQDLEKETDTDTDDLAIIATSPPEIQSIIDRLGKIGFKGALYFASRSVAKPEGMVVRNQDISVELGTLTYHLTTRAASGAKAENVAEKDGETG